MLELGAGWGALLFRLARRYPDVPVIGIELSPVPWAILQLRRRLGHYPNVRVLRRDFFREPFEQAAMVVCFLYPSCMRRLRGKFERELNAGALVLSNHFEIPGWHPVATVPLTDSFSTEVIVYRVPERTAAAAL